MNKQLWSTSYTLFMGGTCGLALCLCFVRELFTDYPSNEGPQLWRQAHTICTRTGVPHEVGGAREE